MAKDRDIIRNLYDEIIEEKITPLAVQGGDGTKPGDLPSETASPTEVQKGTGAENAKDVDSPEEAEEKLSPVKAEKGTKKTASKKEVTAIKDSVEPKKSFMDLFDQVMIKEEGEDIESAGYDDETGDFPEPEGEMGPEEGMEEDEGSLYSQLSDIYAKLAEIKGGGVEADMDDMGDVPDEMTDEIPAGESVDSTIDEMKSEPEPKVSTANSSERQLPTKLAGKGVTKGSSKKAAIKGNDKKRTGTLEDAPEGMRHDKSKFTVKGEGPAHKAKNASFLES